MNPGFIDIKLAFLFCGKKAYWRWRSACTWEPPLLHLSLKTRPKPTINFKF